MSRSVTRKDRQEVAFHPKQKYEERETGWPREIGGWKEKVQGETEKREKDRYRERGGMEGKKSSKLVCSTQQPAGGTKGE